MNNSNIKISLLNIKNLIIINKYTNSILYIIYIK